MLIPFKKTVKLEIVQQVVTQYNLGRQIRNFPERFHKQDSVSIIPYCRFAYLIVKHYHDCRDIDTTTVFIRNNAWIIHNRKLGISIDKSCVDYKVKRSAVVKQVMGDLLL